MKYLLIEIANKDEGLQGHNPHKAEQESIQGGFGNSIS